MEDKTHYHVNDGHLPCKFLGSSDFGSFLEIAARNKKKTSVQVTGLPSDKSHHNPLGMMKAV